MIINIERAIKGNKMLCAKRKREIMQRTSGDKKWMKNVHRESDFNFNLKKRTNSWIKVTFYHRHLLLNDGSIFIEKEYISSKKLSKVAARIELNKREVNERFGKRG